MSGTTHGFSGRGHFRGRGEFRGDSRAARGFPFVLHARGRGNGGRSGGTGGRGTAPGITPTVGPATGMAGGYAYSTFVGRGGRGRVGRGGTATRVPTSHSINTQPAMIHQYNVITSRESEKTVTQYLRMQIMRRLLEVDRPQIFIPRAVYDGCRYLFLSRELSLPNGTQTFDVFLPCQTDAPHSEVKSQPEYQVTITKVATNNPAELARYFEGMRRPDGEVLTANITLNVRVRIRNDMLYPFDVFSFFADQE